jgi:hypothetical protein
MTLNAAEETIYVGLRLSYIFLIFSLSESVVLRIQVKSNISIHLKFQKSVPKENRIKQKQSINHFNDSNLIKV